MNNGYDIECLGKLVLSVYVNESSVMILNAELTELNESENSKLSLRAIPASNILKQVNFNL